MAEYITKMTAVIVLPPDEPIYSERATTVRIEDEAGGEFIEIEQHGRDLGKVQIAPEEWPALRDAIDKMVRECK